jgi:hypothetical protein
MCSNIVVRGEAAADNEGARIHTRSGNPREVRRMAELHQI